MIATLPFLQRASRVLGHKLLVSVLYDLRQHAADTDTDALMTRCEQALVHFLLSDGRRLEAVSPLLGYLQQHPEDAEHVRALIARLPEVVRDHRAVWLARFDALVARVMPAP